MKRLLKIIILFISIVLVLSILGITVLLLPPGDKLRASMVQRKLEEITGADIALDQIKTNLFSHVTLKNLTIVSGLNRYIVGHAGFSFRLPELLKKPSRIRSVSLDSVLIQMSQDSAHKNNQSNLKLFRDDGVSPFNKVRIDEINVRGLQLGYCRVQDPVCLSFTNISIHVKKEKLSYYRIEVDGDEIRADNKDHSIQAHNITGSLIILPDSIHCTSLKLDIFDGSVFMAGSFSIDSPFGGNITARLSDIQTQSLPFYDQPHLKKPYGLLNGTLAITGPMTSPELLSGNIELHWLSLTNKDRIMLTGKLENQGLDIKVDGSDISADAQIISINNRLHGRFKGIIPDLNRFEKYIPSLQLQGKIDFSGTVEGLIQDPRISLFIQGQDLLANGIPADSIHGSMLWQKNQLSFQELRFNTTGKNISMLYPEYLPEKVSGYLGFNGTVCGSLQSPQCEITLRIDDLLWPDIPEISGETHISIRDKKLWLDPIDIHIGTISLKGEGQYEHITKSGEGLIHLFQDGPEAEKDREAGHLTTRFDLKGHSLHINGDQLDIQALSSLFSDSLDISGRLSIQGKWNQQDTTDIFRIKSQISSLTFQSISLDSLYLKVICKPGMFMLDSLQWFDTKHAGFMCLNLPFIHDKTRWQLNRTDPITGHLLIERMDLSVLNIFKGLQLSGQCGMNLLISGILNSPRMTGRMNIHDGRISLAGSKSSVDSIRGDILFQDNRIMIQPLDAVVFHRSVQIRGDLSFEEGFRIHTNGTLTVGHDTVASMRGFLDTDSVHFQTNIDEFPFVLLLPAQNRLDELGGNLWAELVYSKGILPSYSGNLRAQIDKLRFKGWNETWNSGEAQLHFNESTAFIDTFSIKQGNNSYLIASGQIDFGSGSYGARIKAKAANLQLTKSGIFEAALDTLSIDYSDQEAGARLSGTLIMGKTRYTQSIPLQRLITFIKETKTEKPAADWMEKTKIQLQIKKSKNILIDNNLARLRIHPEITLGNTLANPIPTGRINIPEGYLLYLDRKFKIQKGYLDFIDPYRINPFIDITAVSVIKDYETLSHIPYQIFLNIQGNLDQAKVTLASNPSLSQSDLISLLTLGVTSKQKIQNRDQASIPLMEALADRAAHLGSRRISGYLSGEIGKFFGLDEMSVDGNLFKFGRTWGPELVAGKKLTKGMTLIYSITPGNTNKQTMRLDYRLNDFWSIRGEIDQKGETGLDLKYKIKLK